jgi:hypothetical protein
MRNGHVKSRIGEQNLFGALLEGQLGSSKMVKTATYEVTKEVSIDQIKAKAASTMWHVTFR